MDGVEEYIFKADNPFLEDQHSYAKAKSLFRHGILSEAMYALEAEVRSNMPRSSQQPGSATQQS